MRRENILKIKRVSEHIDDTVAIGNTEAEYSYTPLCILYCKLTSESLVSLQLLHSLLNKTKTVLHNVTKPKRNSQIEPLNI